MQFNRSAWLTIDGKTTEIFPNRHNRADAWTADFTEEQLPGGGSNLRLMIHPRADLTVEAAEIWLVFQLEDCDRFFCNGFQSGSETGLLPVGGSLSQPGFFSKKEGAPLGDAHIKGIPRGRGSLHSWSFTYLKKADGRTFFIGSMDEKSGLTLFLLDRTSGRLTIRRDLERLELRHSFPVLNLFFSEKDEKGATAEWLEKVGIAPPMALPTIGWASGQGLSEKLDEAFILKNLASMTALLEGKPRLSTSEKTFLIGNGWQPQTGDWLSQKPGFPSGMGGLAQKIRAAGFTPGLWLTPFVISGQSEIFRKNPSWLLLDERGRPIKIGTGPGPGGGLFALDFYKKEVREWLAGIFHVIFERWGFGLVEVDLLAAACLRPPTGTTRGQAMHGAMEFLRQLTGGRAIVASGAPLGPAMGMADFYSTGSAGLGHQKPPLFTFLKNRNWAAAESNIRSAMGRWPLNGRGFQNAPGAFSLLEKKGGLTAVQQHTLLTINALCSNMLLTGDDPGEWTTEARAEFEEAMELRGAEVLGVFEVQNDVFKIPFFKKSGARTSEGKEAFTAFAHLGQRPVQMRTSDGALLELGAFETRVLSGRF